MILLAALALWGMFVFLLIFLPVYLAIPAFMVLIVILAALAAVWLRSLPINRHAPRPAPDHIDVTARHADPLQVIGGGSRGPGEPS